MNFSSSNSLDLILNGLFRPYSQRVPDVKAVTMGMKELGLINRQENIINDHIAFRTLGVPNLGIASFEHIFLHHGYTKKDHYFFPEKKIDAYWYKPPSENYPRVFISELKVESLSDHSQQIIHSYSDSVLCDPVNEIDLDSAEGVVSFLHRPLWSVPTLEDYKKVLQESEYGAWVLYNRYYLNHYTISVHELPSPYNKLEIFNKFVKSLGIKLNDSGGEIKVSRDGLLRQSSTVAQTLEGKFAHENTQEIAGSYVEFAERLVLPEFSDLPVEKLNNSHRRDGFEVNNADKIFESTFNEQLGKNESN